MDAIDYFDQILLVRHVERDLRCYDPNFEPRDE